MHEDNVDVVKDAYRAINENDFDVLLECFDENVKSFAIGSPHLIPTAGTHYGVEALEHYFLLLGGGGQHIGLSPLEFVAEGDKVVVIGEHEFRVARTGSSIRSPWVHVFSVHRGRITEIRAFYDTAAAMYALDSDLSERNIEETVGHHRVPAIF